MSTFRLNRLRSMGRDELSFRLGVTARKHLHRASTLARRPRWDRAGLAAALTPAVLEGPLADAITQA